MPCNFFVFYWLSIRLIYVYFSFLDNVIYVKSVSNERQIIGYYTRYYCAISRKTISNV